MEEFYKNLIYSLPDIVYQVDINGNFIYINESIQRLGFIPGELTGKHFNVIIAPEDRHIVDRNLYLNRAIAQAAPSSPRFFNERRTGKRITKHLRIRLAYRSGDTGAPAGFTDGEVFATGLYMAADKGGRYAGTIGIIREVKVDVLHEKTLLRIEKYYRLLIDNSFEMITILAHDGTVLFVSNSIERNLGIPPIDYIGENIEDFLHPDDRAALHGVYRQKSGDLNVGRGIEFRILHSNRTWRCFETSATPIMDQNRTHVMCYVLHSMDITRRKEVELALVKRENIYKTLLRTSPDAVALFDDEGDLIMANDKASEIAGNSRVELIGRNYLSFIGESDKKKARGLKVDLEREGIKRDFEFTLVRDTGDKIPVEASFSVMRNVSGSIDGYLCVLRDIANRKKNERVQKRLENELLEFAFGRLSDREIELLKIIVGGCRWPKNKREIGKKMEVLPGTLDQFVGRIKKKLEMEDMDKIAALVARLYKSKPKKRKKKGA